MDGLIYVELLDRHGRVASRHAARALPLRIGRAYDNDLILEDPYVAPYHAVLQRAPDGGLEIVDAGSRNGLFRSGARRRFGRERIDPSARYRAGRTEFRVRPGDHPVAAELPDRGARGLREPLMALAAVLAVVAALVLEAWSGTAERVEVAKLVRTPMLWVVALLIWAGAWGLAGRLLSGERRVAAHLAAAALALTGIFLANRLDYVSFALSAPYTDFLVLCAVWAALAWGLRRHLALALERPGRGTALAAVAVAAACVGLFALLAHLGSADDPTRMAYLKHIKLPEARLVEGTATSQFFSDAVRIKSELEALRTR
jgi:hypothetical protein